MKMLDHPNIGEYTISQVEIYLSTYTYSDVLELRNVLSKSNSCVDS